MKYTPRELSGNVNVSPRSPIREFLILLAATLFAVLGIYALLGLAVDFVATRLSPGTEEHLGRLYAKFYEERREGAAGVRLQGLLDELLLLYPEENPAPVRVHLVSCPHANALALPGRNIVMFSGLLDQVASENELAFVLAHELGHFANNDHLRGLGRALVLVFLAASLFGNDSSVTELAMNSLLGVEMRFSQHQERLADLHALDLVNDRYGHVAGVEDFFRKRAAAEGKGRLSYFFATHPYPLDRIKALEEEISNRGYVKKEKTPLTWGDMKQDSAKNTD